MTTAIHKLWITETGDEYTETNDEFNDWKEAHSSVLFTILRALQDGAKVTVKTQDGLNAQLKINYCKENVSCDINLQSM